MSAYQHYELLCDEPGCDAHRYARQLDLCPAHAGANWAAPTAGDPLPAVCVDEVRDCLAERVRWFEARRRAVPVATIRAANAIADAIRYAAGDGP